MGRAIVISVIILASAIILILLALMVLQPFLNYLSRPADVAAAKRRGDALVRSHGKVFLVVTAHPDDAEWWAGGTLARLAREGNRVILVLGTSGEAGADVPDLGKIREERQKQAAKNIGYEEVIFLRHPDRRLGESKDYPGQVADIIKKVKPDAVFTFDLEREGYIYRHADHQAAGRAAWAAGEDMPGLTYYLFHTNAPDVLTDYASVREDKQRALAALSDYGQNPLWLRVLRPLMRFRISGRRSEFSGGQGVYAEVGVQYGELFRKEAR